MSVAAEQTKGWPHWTTPMSFLEKLWRIEHPIALDPCANDMSSVDAQVQWKSDALDRDWREAVEGVSGGLVFVNPPYASNILGRFVLKCALEASKGLEVVALVPNSSDAAWVHKVVFPTANGLLIWKGRIAFDNPPPGTKKNQPRYQSLVIYWGPRLDLFFWAFQGCGKEWRLR